MNISILDCTLRDGGYMNNWNFKSEHIIKILKSLNSVKVDIIELGYLKNNSTGQNSTLFPNIDVLKQYSTLLNNVKKVAMINLGDWDIRGLEQNNKLIDGIRLAFHKKDLNIAIEQAKIIKNLGYELYFQPMVSKAYSDIEFLKMIELVNDLNPYAFYIVDSFGSMSLKEFSHYLDICENNLKPSIKLGYHSHNNMQLAFCNAIKMCQSNLCHDIILDSSIYGIGRGAGNLNTELIANFLNKEYNKTYNYFYILEVIDELLESLMKTKGWGFSPAQFLSASLDCHPNYAAYLIGQNNYHLTKVFTVLQQIPKDKKINFDKNLITKLYTDSILEQKTKINESINIKDKEIFIIASGYSVAEYKDMINNQIKASKNPCVIALNHKPNDIICDYYLFSNQKRYDAFAALISPKQTIITSNVEAQNDIKNVLDISSYAFVSSGELITNIINIALRWLIANGIKFVNIAGLDGYKINGNNYSYDENDVVIDFNTLKSHNETIEKLINDAKNHINIKFITPTMFN